MDTPAAQPPRTLRSRGKRLRGFEIDLNRLGNLPSLPPGRLAVPLTTQDRTILDASSEKLLLATTGYAAKPSDGSDQARQWLTYYCFVRCEIEENTHRFRACLPGDMQEDMSASIERILSVVAEVAELLRLTSQLSVRQIVKSLVDDQLLSSKCLSPEPVSALACQLVFIAVRWITFLFVDSPPSDNLRFTLLQQHIPSIEVTSQALDMSYRPLLELLHGFGTMLPTMPPHSVSSGDALHVSSLNVGTLCTTGQVHIEWITSVAAHLDFHEPSRTLSIFAMPSFCRIHAGPQSATKGIYDSFHSSDHSASPLGFSAAAYFEEILLSYDLLFRNASSSRRKYRAIHRGNARLALKGKLDPLLDELCGYGNTRSLRNTGIVPTTYSKTADFPILSERLSILENFIRKQKPSNLRMVFKDRRDLNLWYNYWPAILFGIAALVLGLLQVILQVVQTIYSIKAYNAQITQPSSL